MRTLLLFLILTCSFFSCIAPSGHNSKEDTSKEEEKNEQLRIDSLSSIAFKDVLFGISLEEVKNTYVFRDQEPNYLGVIRGNYDAGRIGHRHFIIYGYLIDEKLSKITIETTYMSANYLHSVLIKGAQLIKEDFERKYGKLKTYNNNPRIFEIPPGDSVLMYAGKVGKKFISISILQKSSGAEYKLVAEITHAGYKSY